MDVCIRINILFIAWRDSGKFYMIQQCFEVWHSKVEENSSYQFAGSD